MAKFTAHSVTFDFLNAAEAVVGPITIGAITNSDNPLNTETRGDDGGGLYDTARCTVAQLPEISITTKSIQEVLKITGHLGVCFHSDSNHPGITLFGQLVDECNSGATQNVAIIYPMGLLRPTTLSVNRTDDATLVFTIDALSDGSSAPVNVFVGAILPGSPIAEKYAIGAARVGSYMFDEPTGYTLDFGLSLTDKLPAVGNVWPEVVGVRKSQPVMGVRGQDPTVMDETKAFRRLGSEVGHATSKFFLKKRAKLNAFELPGALAHFYVTVNGQTVVNNPFSTSGDGVADFDAKIECTDDGENAPLLFGFDVAYSSIAL